MKKYVKPICVTKEQGNGLIPALGAAALSVTGAAIVGAAAGLASKGGDNNYFEKGRSLPECITIS